MIGALAAALVAPAQSLAANVTIQGARISFVAADGEQNFVTVDALDTGSDTYTLHDTGAPTLTADAPCTAAGSAVTCPAAGIKTIGVDVKDQSDTVNMNAVLPRGTWINGGDGNDTINGGPGDDLILGGQGWDSVQAGLGNDKIDSGSGGVSPDPTVDFPFEWLRGGQGVDTITYANRAAAVVIDISEHAQAPFALDPADTPDPDFPYERIDGFEKVIGTQYDDFIVGSILNETFVGGLGSDVMCGGLGVDTVDYSDHDASHPVNVTLDGNPSPPHQTTVATAVGTTDTTIQVASTAGFWNTGTLQVDDEQFTYTGKTEASFTGVSRHQKETAAATHAVGAVVSDPSQFPNTDPRTAFSLIGTLHQINEYRRARTDCRPVGNPDPLTIPGGPYPVFADGVSPVFYDRDAYQFDCAYNDGSAGEDDCVGQDIENVIGSRGDDVLTGNDPDALVGQGPKVEPLGANELDGGEGDDVLDGRYGPDVFDGGPGSDTVTYADRTVPLKASIDGGANDGDTDPTHGMASDFDARSGLSDRIGPTVENIIGGSANDELVGDGNANTLSGGAGDDTLKGNAGNDTLNGGDGNDSLEGSDDNDTLAAGAGDDGLKGGFGSDTFDGGDGSDTLDYSDATTAVFAAPDGVANDGPGEGDNLLGGIESLIGSPDNDTLVGDDAPGTLQGGAGNDTLDGGGGADHLMGGDGLDIASYAGRSGSVTVDLAAGTAGEPGEGDAVDGDVEGAAGGSGNDSIGGSDGVNLLFGGSGNDTINGLGGDDQIFGGDGDDTADGGGGSDKVAGDAGNDTARGGADSDTVDGGLGDDQLDGGPASDVLIGGAGSDLALYSARTKAVKVTLDGADNDGESTEHDQIRSTVEGTKTGGGNDSINVRDGIAGDVTCGGGTDVVVADMVDTIGDDCEQKNVLSSAVCSVRSKSAKMKRSGVVGIRVTCPVSGKGKLTLRTSGAYKAAKKTRKKVTLGRKSFKLKAGRSKTIKVKLSKKGRRLVRKNKRLHVRATVAVKAASASNTTRRGKTLTIKAAKRKK